jgi:hypothetical protein
MVLALDTDFIMFALEQEEQQMRDWKKQLQYDKEISHARKNLKQLLKVLELHNMECPELSKVDLLGLNLTDMSTILFMNDTFSLCFQDVF